MTFAPPSWIVPCVECGTPVGWCAPRFPTNRKFVVPAGQDGAHITMCFPCQDRRGVYVTEDAEGS